MRPAFSDYLKEAMQTKGLNHRSLARRMEPSGDRVKVRRAAGRIRSWAGTKEKGKPPTAPPIDDATISALADGLSVDRQEVRSVIGQDHWDRLPSASRAFIHEEHVSTLRDHVDEGGYTLAEKHLLTRLQQIDAHYPNTQTDKRGTAGTLATCLGNLLTHGAGSPERSRSTSAVLAEAIRSAAVAPHIVVGFERGPVNLVHLLATNILRAVESTRDAYRVGAEIGWAHHVVDPARDDPRGWGPRAQQAPDEGRD
jgi:hypothetical protein